MNMEKHISGFELVKSQKISEVNGEGFEYVHQKTKAHLVFLKTDDKNKAFAIGFRTPPHDSTGVPHIIEHSVLCGSDKFTTKEPFVDLMKGSLNTFLNAMTYPDKTMYPFSSQNIEDYKNILHIYVDAVFNPKMKTIKEIFMQEGWHYEIADKDAPLTLNGVVYNEMKGAYSSPEEILDNEITNAIFDNCYQYSSGGDPDVIPELTYEDFKAFHEKYYHPSNCCIYIYGDIDAAEIMEILDRDYLSKFDFKEIDSEIGLTKPFDKEKNLKGTYSIGKDDSDEGKTYAEITYVIPEGIDSKLATAMDTMASALFNADSACIKNKILDAGLCQNIQCYFDNHKLQPTFNIIIQNTTDENAKKIFDIIESSLKELSENGIDRKLIEGCILSNEFSNKEYITIKAGRGVNMASSIFARYFYGRDPFEELKINGQFDYAKSLLENKGFEGLIKKYLIDNQFRAKIILNPEKGLSEKKADALAKKLADFKATLSDEQIKAIMDEEAVLKLRQRTPDSEEDLKTIPNLKVSDIEKKVSDLSVSETKKNGYNLYHYNAETNGIVYGRMLTDASVLESEELPYLGFVCNALSMLPTENYTVTTLPNAIMENIGDISFTASAISDNNDSDKAYKFFEINFKAMEEKFPNAVEIIKEILNKTNFNSKERLKQILNIIVSRMESEMISNGHIYGMIRVGANLSPASRFTENCKFYTYYQFVKDIANNFDKKADEFISKSEAVLKKVLNSNNTIVSVAGNNHIKELFEKEIDKICSEFKPVSVPTAQKFERTHINEGIMTTSNVQYVTMGYDFKEFGIKHTGKMDVLQTIMSTDYAWNNIRVLGGAYGAPFRITNEGVMFSSYRDPHLNNSMKVYREAGEYFKNLELTETEFNNYIIGTISSMDMPKTAEQKCVMAVNNMIAHITDKDRQTRRDEVLSAKLSEINALGDMLTKITDKNLYVVFGNEKKIKENEKLFDRLSEAK